MAEQTRTIADERRVAYLATESQRTHYKEIADKINNEQNLLQKMWNPIGRALLGIPLVTPENVESVAVTGRLPRLNLGDLKGPTGIIPLEIAIGSGLGYAAFQTILVGAGIALPVVGIPASIGLIAATYRAIRFRHENETRIENLIKMELELAQMSRREVLEKKRINNEEIKEKDAYAAAESSFQHAGYVVQGEVFRVMLKTLSNYAVTQRKAESKFDPEEEKSWSDEQKKAAFVINYLEQNEVIRRKSKRDGYFSPEERYRVNNRHDRQYTESEHLSKQILDFVSYAEEAYENQKRRKQLS